jgi:hypothetical protein
LQSGHAKGHINEAFGQVSEDALNHLTGAPMSEVFIFFSGIVEITGPFDWVMGV